MRLSQCQGWSVLGSGHKKSKGRKVTSEEGGRGEQSGVRRRGDSHNHLAGHGEDLGFYFKEQREGIGWL